MNPNNMHATTIIGIHRNGKTALCGDGQVSMGDTVVKAKAIKIRRIFEDKVIIGFAGATADAFTLSEKFEEKLKANKGNLKRSAVELAKEWRQDKYLRRLEAMIIAGDKTGILMISGVGDVMEPDDGLMAIGSGGNYALAAARALMRNTKLSEEKIVSEAMKIASEICIYTNSEFVLEVL
ncbi:MAG: ATP-dependent protease subunit HslV [Candidatus Cloacimonetes bacterium]|jgi:ATP-dependent HslUV protease subunit HslV|nr:ATP-dependent protease subunit HslV [Candidatus Cloacimonadota bacterium]MDD2422637.1 ATP-dependent protease subunit HslV [Candidatus Cloacimonadota bacterium]MDD3562319.1 ATP-dependent protease subunit HslV [Candidatus Cloacimonadota bacterium]MDD4277240.1 ATP-dependent protease subunit HslV [Candidatus Cloacimonadota bacterium]MDY0324716.1 ATP-dependent protease subunit HslV [Candidatus Cloacimonadaceae bacterium]